MPTLYPKLKLLFALLFVIKSFLTYNAHNYAQDIREKWSSKHLIRDLDHIKEDVKLILDLNVTGEMTENERTFYLIRMHDFDDNGGLDGIEIRAALLHAYHDTEGENIEVRIEDLMQYDESNDGFVDYGEFRRGIDSKP